MKQVDGGNGYAVEEGETYFRKVLRPTVIRPTSIGVI